MKEKSEENAKNVLPNLQFKRFQRKKSVFFASYTINGFFRLFQKVLLLNFHKKRFLQVIQKERFTFSDTTGKVRCGVHLHK